MLVIAIRNTHWPQQFPVIVSAFSGRPGVDLVQDQRTILEKFFRLLAS